MREITEDLELCQFDGVRSTAVYVGFFENLKRAKLEWEDADEGTSDALALKVKVLNLSQIVEQVEAQYEVPIITVFVNGPLHGEIYQYGNYNDGKWWQIGETCGYA